MQTFDTVADLVAALPATVETRRHGNRAWAVHDRVFAWQRPFSKADLTRFGDATPPAGPILAVGVGDLGEKDAIIAGHPAAIFTIPHFDGYPAVLIDLAVVTKPVLRATLTDGWACCAPDELIAQHRRGHRRR